MAELRAGGLAILIKSRFAGNVGKVVLVKRFYGEHALGDRDCWMVEVISPGMMGVNGPCKIGSEAACRSGWLMPIDDADFSHEKESEKQLQNA